MKLVVLTPEITTGNEQEMVISMLINGPARVHVRKPGFSYGEYRRYLDSIPEYFHQRLVIHDHFELFSTYNLGGVHLSSAGRDDLVVMKQVEKIPRDRLSTSFHSWAEIEENKETYSYVFISPVFDSISKPGYEAAIDLEGAPRTKERFAASGNLCPGIIGLGGVGPEQIHILMENGFDGAAMLGAIWSSPDPLAAYQEAVKAATVPGGR